MEKREASDRERHFEQKVTDEYLRAKTNWPDWHSAHEGYGVLLEEVDELWDHVKTKQGKRDYGAMQEECVQIAAMAMRMYFDCCSVDGNGYQK